MDLNVIAALFLLVFAGGLIAMIGGTAMMLTLILELLAKII